MNKTRPWQRPILDGGCPAMSRVWIAVLIALAAGCGGGVSSDQRAAYQALQTAVGAENIATDEKGNVIKVIARGSAMTDRVARHLQAFPQLQSLQIENSQVTDAGLENIRNLRHLETLRAERTKITDEGMKYLLELTSLHQLFLTGCQVTDDGLVPLQGLTQLRLLNLNDTGVSDVGLDYLAALTNLDALYLRNTQISGSGLETLRYLRQLRLINLGGTEVTDQSLQYVGQFENLEQLYLDSTPISDEAIPELVATLTRSTPKLKGLFLENTKLTDASVEPLKKLAGLKDLAIVHLHGTRITKPAFLGLVRSLPEVSFVADYGEDP